MRRAFLGLAMIAGACGRVGFDPLATGDGAIASGDGVADAVPFCSGGGTACPTGATFCDDFETSSGVTFPAWTDVGLGNWNTTGAADPTTQITSTSSACRGTIGAHVHTLGGAQVAVLHVSMPARPNPLYARLWLRIASTSSADDYEMLGLQTTSGNFINIGLKRDTAELGVNTQGLPAGLAGMFGGAPVAADRWMCFELRVLFNASTAGELRLAIDGATVLDLTGVATEGGSPIDQLFVGAFTGLNETGTYDVDYDEIVVSGQPIGCI